jgi:hypothetical protein
LLAIFDKTRYMTRLLYCLLLTCLCKYTVAQQPYWQQQVNYDIRVTLNDADHSLDAFEKITYFNNSPDTLHFIWLHLWPNAYKNDRTAFSDQLLVAGRTDFYFSSDEQRGYINRLNIKVNGNVVLTTDHPQHQDIIKIVFTTPLAPHSSCVIETPFHVKLPYNFSRGGHKGQAYQITQWYPKPAVYDKKGWHPMPYLNQSEFYSDYGNYTVHITVPKGYVVAATGEQQVSTTADTDKSNSLHYQQNNVHDFAWFADKRLRLHQDTVQLPSGKMITAFAYTIKNDKNAAAWKNVLPLLKKAVLTRSALLGDYPYSTIKVVQPDVDYAWGMEYPTITAISNVQTPGQLEGLLEHEAGHNWLYAAIGSNERLHPWMDEGMNTYYGTRYWKNEVDINVRTPVKQPFLKSRMPENMNFFGLENAIATNTDQPINQPADLYSGNQYDWAVYHKASRWLQAIQQQLGTPLFDSCMQQYYQRWLFKHPYPEDFKAVLEEISGSNMDSCFALLQQTGSLPGNTHAAKTNKLASFFSFKQTNLYRYHFIAPAVGFNLYDKLMIGAVLHNYTLPAQKFQYLLMPLFATGSKQLNGISRAAYHWLPKKTWSKIELSLNYSRFSFNHSTDTSGKKITENYKRLVPAVRFYLKNHNATASSYIDMRSFILTEKYFDSYNYITGSDSSLLYPSAFTNSTRYINQLTFAHNNSRVLYPFSYQVQLQQGKGFYRINTEGNYFFNYAKGGGMAVRFFAAKFGLMGTGSNTAYLYQPKLLAGNGEDDYTNSHYFLGRTASTAFGKIPVNNGGLAAQQVMIQNTGGLKLRLDPYTSVQGYSGNWVMAVNFSSTLPQKLFPIKIPLKVFFDAATYAEAWNNDEEQSRLFYTAGLQLSLFKNVLNIYAPLFYSKAFKDQLKTDPENNKFFKKISFSINLQEIKLKKFVPQLVY